MIDSSHTEAETLWNHLKFMEQDFSSEKSDFVLGTCDA